MQNKLVLKDGTEIINGSASRFGEHDLMIRIPGNDFINAVEIFSDPNKISEITCYASIYKMVYTGYTQMYSIQYFTDEGNNYLEVWLRGTEVNHTKEITVPRQYVPEQMLQGVDSNA